MADRLPGVIVKITAETGVVVPRTYERFPVIIGQGETELLIENEAVLHTGVGSADVLQRTPVHRVISIGDIPNQSKYTSPHDYSLVGNTIDWSASGDEPSSGSIYYVSYTTEVPATAYTPTLYFDENLIFPTHGNRVRVDGSINPVVVGSNLAFLSGALGVIVAQLDLRSAVDPAHPTGQEIEDAYTDATTGIIEKLEKITDFKLFLVPLDAGLLGTQYANDLLFNHAVVASLPENKQERTVIAAVETGTTAAQFEALAQNYANERMVVPAAPNGEVSVSGFSGTYDQTYLSAGFAGLLCSRGIGRAVTDQVVRNVGLVDDFTPRQMRDFVRVGVSPFTTRDTLTRAVFPITTDTTNSVVEDLAVQDIADYTRRTWREVLQRNFIGIPITASTPQVLEAASRTILDDMISNGILADYEDIRAVQDASEPRLIEIYGRVKPAFPLQFIDVNFVFTGSL